MGKSKHPKPLVPHVEGEYLQEVVVMRIPPNTPPDQLREATKWQHNLAKKINDSRKDIYWMEERQYARKK